MKLVNEWRWWCRVAERTEAEALEVLAAHGHVRADRRLILLLLLCALRALFTFRRCFFLSLIHI